MLALPRHRSRVSVQSCWTILCTHSLGRRVPFYPPRWKACDMGAIRVQQMTTRLHFIPPQFIYLFFWFALKLTRSYFALHTIALVYIVASFMQDALFASPCFGVSINSTENNRTLRVSTERSNRKEIKEKKRPSLRTLPHPRHLHPLMNCLLSPASLFPYGLSALNPWPVPFCLR